MKNKVTFRNAFLLILDLIVIIASVVGAFALRFELVDQFYLYLPSAYWMVGIAIVVKLGVFYFFGLYRRMWSYASVQELKLVFFAVTTGSAFVSLIMIILAAAKVFPYFSRGILIIDWMLTMLMIGGVRFVFRVLADSKNSLSDLKKKANKRTLIIGAGDAGAMVVKEFLWVFWMITNQK